jgi:hypothetical protein
VHIDCTAEPIRWQVQESVKGEAFAEARRQ